MTDTRDPSPSSPPRGASGGSIALGLGLVGVGVVGVLLLGGIALGAAWWLLDLGAATTATGGREVSAPSADAEEGYTVWARNDDGRPVRWDPCSPVELAVAPDGAPPGFLADLDIAARRIAAATGLEVVVTGHTDERPSRDRAPYQPDRYGHRWAPVLVAWASAEQDDTRLRDIDRAVATPVAVGRDGDRTYVTGQIVFNRDRDDLAGGFDDRATSWGATILHELGHLVGLGHVDDPDELMAVHPGHGPVRFGPGDLRGLAAVGADHGCIQSPEPQPVDVNSPSG